MIIWLTQNMVNIVLSAVILGAVALPYMLRHRQRKKHPERIRSKCCGCPYASSCASSLEKLEENEAACR